MNKKATYEIAEVAELIGIARNTAYAAVARDGELLGVPVLKVGRRLLFPRAAIDEVLGIATTIDGNPTTKQGA